MPPPGSGGSPQGLPARGRSFDRHAQSPSGLGTLVKMAQSGKVIAKGTTTTKMIGGKVSGKSYVYLTKTHSVYEVGVGPQVF